MLPYPPIVLAANTSYYLLSQETIGGDTWQDYGPVATTTDAAITGAVYTDIFGVPVMVPSSTGDSYVPLDFLYIGGGNPGQVPTISVFYSVTPQAGYDSFAVDATAAAGSTIASVQFQLNNQNFGAASTPSSPGGSYYVNDVVSGTYALTGVATDSVGRSAQSAPVSLPISTTV